MTGIDDNEFKKVEDIKRGEFVRRKVNANKTYIRGDYCRENERYSLQDTEDMCREIFVKKGTLLHVGFTF